VVTGDICRNISKDFPHLLYVPARRPAAGSAAGSAAEQSRQGLPNGEGTSWYADVNPGQFSDNAGVATPSEWGYGVPRQFGGRSGWRAPLPAVPWPPFGTAGFILWAGRFGE